MICGTAGATDLAIRAAWKPTPLALAGVGLLLVGFGFKISSVPFHMWTPDAYEGAPTPVTGFMAVGVKAAAFAAFLRVFLVGFDLSAEKVSALLWVFAVATMTVGNLAAIAQHNIKRMLAYSSIAHAGYVLVGMVAGTASGQAAMLYYLLAYAFMNLGAFAVVILLVRDGEEREEISDLAGLGYARPALGLAMTLFMLSRGIADGLSPEVLCLPRGPRGRVHLARDPRRAQLGRVDVLLPARDRHHVPERADARPARLRPSIACGFALLVSTAATIVRQDLPAGCSISRCAACRL
jgi:hypothetical protein